MNTPNPSSDSPQNIKACCDIERSTSVLCRLEFLRRLPALLAKADIARDSCSGDYVVSAPMTSSHVQTSRSRIIGLNARRAWGCHSQRVVPVAVAKLTASRPGCTGLRDAEIFAQKVHERVRPFVKYLIRKRTDWFVHLRDISLIRITLRVPACKLLFSQAHVPTSHEIA